MSSASLHKVVCPKCGKEQTIERYDSINNHNWELFPRIVDKSIFDYECKSCKEKVHAPYPLIFHKMGIRDVQIGYKIEIIPIQPTFISFFNPKDIAMKKVMEDSGHKVENILEYYDNEDEFARRVNDFVY